MTKILFYVTEDAADGGYVVQALGHGITTQAESFAELKTMILDAAFPPPRIQHAPQSYHDNKLSQRLRPCQ